MRSLAWRVALLAMLAASARADDAGPWRAVVQQAAPAFLAVSANGRLALSVEGDGRHVLHAVDTSAGRILMTAHLPESIVGVALSNGGDRFAVGTEAGVYIGSLETGRFDRVLTGAVGKVALSAAGDSPGPARGHSGAATGISRSAPSWMQPRVLGLYDLDARAWLARVPTPIVTPGEVAFDGDVLVGAGQGGRVYNRRSSSFACDVRLEPNGRWALNRGDDVERAKDDASGYERPAVIVAQSIAREGPPDREATRAYAPHYFLGSTNGFAEPFAVTDGPDAVKVAVWPRSSTSGRSRIAGRPRSSPWTATGRSGSARTSRSTTPHGPSTTACSAYAERRVARRSLTSRTG